MIEPGHHLESDYQCCLILPHYNHVRELTQFLPKLLSLDLLCIIIDDGSDDEEKSRLIRLLEDHPKIELIFHHHNRGKGAAVMTAAVHARSRGMTHIFQVDADGQHNLEDVSGFIAASKAAPLTIVCGKPVFDETAPKARVYGRKVTDFWVSLETLSLKIKDGLCGFRIYPLEQLERLMDDYYLGPRMDFDTEVLVKAVWHQVPLRFLDTQVQYIHDGTSHFHYLRDNLVLIRLHTRLMFGMVRRLPRLILNFFN
ncbi:MAG: glycosyltransferase family 2 protein [Acidiferrobacterales bacterium]|nr:glycosyltransferase family 2 protein [Acidiferrobacterales bacterium]